MDPAPGRPDGGQGSERTLSQEEARRFIAQRYGLRAGAPRPLGEGAWSRVYALTLDGRDVVAKFGAHREDMEKDRVMGVLGPPAVPVPRVLEMGEAPGGFFCVAERVHGAPLDELDADGMRAVLPDLLRVLDALAAVDVSDRTGYGSWGPGRGAGCRTWREAVLQFAGDRLAGWQAALEESPTGTGPLRAGVARLQALARDLPDVRQVIHSDLLHMNVLVEGTSVRGVLDWGNSMYGDALFDAAWLRFWWPWHPRWSGIDIGAELERHWRAAGAGPPDRGARLLCYELRIGLEHLAWYAWRRQWDHLGRAARQVLQLAEG